MIFAIMAAFLLAASVDAPKFTDSRCTQLRREFIKTGATAEKAVKNEDWNGAQDAVGYMRGVDKALNLFCEEDVKK